MNDKLREAAHALLQATEYMLEATKHLEPCPATVDEAEAATAALRAALMSVPDGAEQPAEQEPAVLHQFHKRGCADWYDGLPDHEDGGGPYETRTLYTAPPPAQQCNCVKRESLTDFDIADRFYAIGGAGANSLRYFAAGVRYAEVAHGIGGEV